MTTRAQLADLLSKFNEIHAALDAVTGKEGANDPSARTIRQMLEYVLFYGSLIVVGQIINERSVDCVKNSNFMLLVVVFIVIWGLANR